MAATLTLALALAASAAVACGASQEEQDAARGQQCALPEQRDPEQPPRSIAALTALIAQYEAGLDALRRERVEAFQIAREAGSPEVIAAGLDFPTPGDGPPPPMDRWLEPKAWFHVGEKLSALSALPPVPPRGSRPPGSKPPVMPTYYVAGDVEGRLHFFKYPEERLLAQPYDTQHGAAITAIGFGRRDEHLLVTAAADGSVHMHNLTLPQVPRAVRPPKRKPGEPVPPPPPPPEPTPLTVEFGRVAYGPDGDGAAVTGLQVYRRHRHEMVVTADDAGSIRVLFANGTEYAASNTSDLSNPPPPAKKRGKQKGGSKAEAPATAAAEPAPPPPPLKPPAGVIAMRASTSAKVAQFIAVSIGGAIGFFDLKKMGMIQSRCSGLATHEVVTSMEYDIVHSNILYAATAQGKVLVARVGSDGSRVDCRVLRRLDATGAVSSPTAEAPKGRQSDGGAAAEPPPPAEDSHGDTNRTTNLGVVKGHLLAGDVHGVVVYNTTRVQHRGGGGSLDTLFRSHFTDSKVGLELADSPMLSVTTAADESVVLLASTDGKLLVFESQLPAAVEDGWDLSKTRMPVVAGAVMLVFGYVQYRHSDSDLKFRQAVHIAGGLLIIYSAPCLWLAHLSVRPLACPPRGAGTRCSSARKVRWVAVVVESMRLRWSTC